MKPPVPKKRDSAKFFRDKFFLQQNPPYSADSAPHSSSSYVSQTDPSHNHRSSAHYGCSATVEELAFCFDSSWELDLIQRLEESIDERQRRKERYATERNANHSAQSSTDTSSPTPASNQTASSSNAQNNFAYHRINSFNDRQLDTYLKLKDQYSESDAQFVVEINQSGSYNDTLQWMQNLQRLRLIASNGITTPVDDDRVRAALLVSGGNVKQAFSELSQEIDETNRY